jgi:hypothetical protein
MKKNGGFSENWVSGGMGTKWEFWGNGRPAVSGLTGEWPAVVLWWWVGRWVVVGWCGRVDLESEGRKRGFGKKGNGGGREVGGGWFGRRMTGDGVSVVGEVDAGGGWRWVSVFGFGREEGRRRGWVSAVRLVGK